MASITTLQQAPLQSPMTDQNGVLTPIWQQWLSQLYKRVGGPVAVSNTSVSGSSNLLFSSYVGNSNTTMYTSPSGQNTVINAFSLQNTSPFAQTVSAYIVPAGGSPSTSNKVLSSYSAPATSTVNVASMLNQVIPPGGTLVAIAAIGSAIIMKASGSQFS